MRDFGLLLKEAAGTPPRPLNMHLVHQRAVRLGTRRRARLWLAAVLALVGVGGGGLSLLPTTDSSGTLRTVNLERDASDRRLPRAVEPPPSGATQAADTGQGPPAGADNMAARPDQPAPSPGEPSSAPPSKTGTTPPPRTADGCSRTNVNGTDDGPGVFVGYGHYCRFIASSPGGYEAAGQWRITIVRQGRTTTYQSGRDAVCAPTGTVQSGDDVTIEIEVNSSASVGSDYGKSCVVP